MDEDNNIPSMTHSTSEMEEEERRRILEGIFAEEDDDSSEEGGEESFASSEPPMTSTQADEAERQQEEGDADGIAANIDNAAAEDDANEAHRMVEMARQERAEAERRLESLRGSAGSLTAPTASAFTDEYVNDQRQQRQQQRQLLPNKAASRKLQRVNSNAFSSSSDEEVEGEKDVEATPMRASNSKISDDTRGGDNNDDGGGGGGDGPPQPDLMDATSKFSWIHSADSGGINDAENNMNAQTITEITEEVGAAAPGGEGGGGDLKFSFSQDEGTTTPSNAKGRSSPPVAGSTTAAKQSEFDKALTEVRRQGGRSRSNSFTFASVGSDSPDAKKDAAVGGEEVGGGEDGISADVLPKEGRTANAGDGASSTNNNDSVEDAGGAADDDFFAKAESTVLDEIFSENFENFNAIEDDAKSGEGNEGGGDAAKAASSGGDETSPSSAKDASTSKDATKSTIISTNDGGKVKDKISATTKRSGSSQSEGSSTSGLPDVLSSMRQKIESFNIFDGGDAIMSNVPLPSSDANNITSDGRPGQVANKSMLAMDNTSSSSGIAATTASTLQSRYYTTDEERESMRRAFQQSISAAVLVSLAHKRYERRRLAAMEIEKVVRSLVIQQDYNRVRSILLLLSDDYVRSTNEDARKGGAVALAACAIGLKKANEGRRDVIECRDLILASVVHACQDHSQRVRYYATESLFNVTKVIPSLAVQHFIILFEILRSLYADVDLDVRSGAELLDKKLKEVIVGAINSGSFSADACVPVFARFVYMRNKATKQLTLTWLKEFSEKLIGAPILQFLHLFLGGIFGMVADPNVAIRQLALEFLQSVLPKLLVANNEDFEDPTGDPDAQQRVCDFDKILQSLVLISEHPDPFVRKVAMYWMSRIVQAHMSSAFPTGSTGANGDGLLDASMMGADSMDTKGGGNISAASISVRNALPHVLPGILLSIGDTHQSRGAKDSFLPDQTTHSLAEQANTCLQDAVRRDGKAFIPHLGGFIVALREELDSPGGLIARNPPSLERRPYRMDVKADGSGIESTGWFRASDGVEERDNALILSRLCALQWVVVLYEHVVPNSLKAEYASEFIDCIIYQLVDQPPGIIIVKSFEVLAKISSPAEGEKAYLLAAPDKVDISSGQNPMSDENANFALGIILDPTRRKFMSRDRSVFASLIDLHSKNQKLLLDISKVIELMCT